MWEYSICFDSRVECELLVCSISKVVKKNNGIITSVFSQGFYNVLIAIPNEIRDSFYNILCEKIAEVILKTYKKRYILNGLKFEKTKTTNMFVFLQALICFDSEIDKQIILKNLEFKNVLYFSAFINFKLKFLKLKWNELTTLANDNTMYLFCEDSFVELIKFLISNLEHRCYAVNIFTKGNCYLLCDMQGNMINDFLIENSKLYDDNNLITSLIALNPEKIIIHCNRFLKETLLKYLYNFFPTQVEICK